VPIPEGDRFEQYLKKFQPLAPEPLPSTETARGTHRRFVFGAWSAVAATIVVTVLLLRYPRPKSGYSPDGSESRARVELQGAPPSNPQPLTIGTANALLARAQSTKAAVDGVAAQAFQSHAIPSSAGKQSALAVLSKEKTKL